MQALHLVLTNLSNNSCNFLSVTFCSNFRCDFSLVVTLIYFIMNYMYMGDTMRKLLANLIYTKDQIINLDLIHIHDACKDPAYLLERE